MRIAVISAIVGSHGSIRDPSTAFANTDYYYFSDVDFNNTIWQYRSAYKFSSDITFGGRRNAKLYKVLGSFLIPGYDYYIWHDNHIEVKVDPNQLIEQYLHSADIALFKHAERDCSYAELAVLAERRYDTEKNLMSAVNFLQENSYGFNQGLFEMTSFLYRATPTVRTMMLSWWELICAHTSRDQVLFPYVLYKHQVKYSILPGAALPYAGSNSIFPSVRGKYS